MTSIHDYLQTYFDADGVDLTPMAALFELIELQKNDYFLKMDQYTTRLGFIHEGLLRFYAYNEDGSKEVTQWIANQGMFVTDLSSFVFDAPSRWHIQALSDVKIYVIRRADYRRLDEIITDWATIETRFIAKCFVHLENRVFQQLSMSAEEKYVSLLQYMPEIFNQAPLQYIASMLGMTPETLSRLRRKRVSGGK
ncbi:MAG: Crp/Fnr family transcriptional regulator [Bacteroidota bacterium]